MNQGMVDIPAAMQGRIEYLLSAISVADRSPSDIRADVVTAGVSLGYSWREIVLVVDELERKTGLLLHLTRLL